MIESCYWKEELARISRQIGPRAKRTRWTERAHCVVERDIIIGFFMVRRLIELHKISSATRDMTLSVFSCPARGEKVTRMNHHRIEELYSLEGERPERKKPFYMSNQFIHSYTSFVVRDESHRWCDVFVVSDYDRDACIWRVPIREIHRLFSTASKDYPHTFEMKFSAEKGDYLVTTN